MNLDIISDDREKEKKKNVPFRDQRLRRTLYHFLRGLNIRQFTTQRQDSLPQLAGKMRASD
jgi:hypothetical protein